MDLEKGNLVKRRKDGAYGIVISVDSGDAEVFFGDGLREITAVGDLMLVGFNPVAIIPANFTELVDAYVTCRGYE